MDNEQDTIWDRDFRAAMQALAGIFYYKECAMIFMGSREEGVVIRALEIANLMKEARKKTSLPEGE